MSRLPKRKLELDDIAEQDEPRKLSTLRSTTNFSFTNNTRPVPLTKPSAPSFTSGVSKPTRSARGASAPPASSTASALTRRAAPPPTTRRPRAPSVASGPSAQAARQANNEQIAASIAFEKAKVKRLEEGHTQHAEELAKLREAQIADRRDRGLYEDELREARRHFENEKLELELALRRKEREAREALDELRMAREDLERERVSVSTLKTTLSTQSGTLVELESRITTLLAQRDALQLNLDGSGRNMSTLRLQLQDAYQELEKLRSDAHAHEALRRKLHNTIQELKGNIRVFARVRPILPSDKSEDSNAEPAAITFPDDGAGEEQKQIALLSTSESAMGKERKETYNFSFDRVFAPATTQEQIFTEVAALTQSCLDGYNVCIFAYGQTGSGKSYTMEGSSAVASSSTSDPNHSGLSQTRPHAGLIPRAVEHIFEATHAMEKHGWTWIVEGWFLEIYNEQINDLLCSATSSTSKHEIHHHRSPHTNLPSTTVTNATIIPLSSPEQVAQLLEKGRQNRKTGKTRLNDRSSRGHAVFGIRVRGERARADGTEGDPERLEGTLNLVDLAGCERINVSFFPGSGSSTGNQTDSLDGVGVLDAERLKETQSINKSLSSLGDVIAALGERSGQGGVTTGHIPYRNSKLTYLLQNSLGGGAKVLMVLNVSPLAAHLGESINSLRFATKVNSTVVGGGGKKAAGKN